MCLKHVRAVARQGCPGDIWVVGQEVHTNSTPFPPAPSCNPKADLCFFCLGRFDHAERNAGERGPVGVLVADVQVKREYALGPGGKLERQRNLLRVARRHALRHAPRPALILEAACQHDAVCCLVTAVGEPDVRRHLAAADGRGGVHRHRYLAGLGARGQKRQDGQSSNQNHRADGSGPGQRRHHKTVLARDEGRVARPILPGRTS